MKLFAEALPPSSYGKIKASGWTFSAPCPLLKHVAFFFVNTSNLNSFNCGYVPKIFVDRES
jgi:hypothetical protein